MSERKAEAARQLTLLLEAQVLLGFDNFLTGGNAELVHRLQVLAAGAESLGAWISGEPGGGKSHLLQATCRATERAGRRSIYVPLDDLAEDARAVESLEADLIALDDVDAWLGQSALEAVLMGVYQQQLQVGGQIVFAAAHTAQQTSFDLPDLASRCRALPGYRVVPPDDDGLREILIAAAHRRGLTLTDAVLDYWLHRAVRALPELLAQLESLDEQALVEQRAVTIPLIKEVLGL
ncbi:MAG: DnaA regulatory inactivator Hda [Gammaproteobacteria bacterium]|nr:MAG: DnaA regulatory inactivator Hda [Gammaproteobacteria bacterium]